MTKLSFAVSPVEVSAQSVTMTVDPTEFAPIAMEAIFIYGLRRWFQDHVNSAAFTFKKAAEEAKAKGEDFNGGQPFDAHAQMMARLEAAKTGVLSAPRASSAPGFTDQEEAIYTLVYSQRKAPAFATIAAALKEANGMDTDSRKALVLKAVAALPEALLAKVTAAAAATVAAKASLDGLTL